MTYKTRAFFVAKCEAQDAKIIALERECTRLRAERDKAQFDTRNFESELIALRNASRDAARDEAAITFGALQERCKRLNASGVPAVIHRGHVLHTRTRAIIQPGQFGAGT